jgi:hypothetical protein
MPYAYFDCSASLARLHFQQSEHLLGEVKGFVFESNFACKGSLRASTCSRLVIPARIISFPINPVLREGCDNGSDLRECLRDAEQKQGV